PYRAKMKEETRPPVPTFVSGGRSGSFPGYLLVRPRLNPRSGMSSVSLPVHRPAGHALVVGPALCRARPAQVLRELGFACAEADDPYSAMAELCRRPAAYRALILSLQSVYPEELQLIPAVKRRCPQVEVWLTDID